MFVVDTNILAYLLIVGDRTKEAQALFARDAEWKSEAFVMVEFSNILATYQRLGELTGSQAELLLNEAEALLHSLVNLPTSRRSGPPKGSRYPPTMPAFLPQRRIWVHGWSLRMPSCVRLRRR